jgi:hypothetical protein
MNLLTLWKFLARLWLTNNSSNYLAFSTTSEAIRIISSGNVGIGTSSPRVKLDLRSDAVIAAPTPLANAVTSGVFAIGDSVGSVVGLQLNGSSYDTYIQSRNMGAGSAAYNLLLQPLGGNVGIGTSSPTQTLHIKGETSANIVFEDTTSGVAGFIGPSANNQSDTTATRLGIRGEAGISFSVGAATKATIDSSGNVGIGVVPDAWSGTGAAIQLEGAGHLATANQYAYIGSNYYYNGGWKYTTSSTAAQYRQDSGTHQWLTAASGSADAAITWSESMRIDSSGNTMVGLTTAQARFTIGGAAATAANSTLCRIGNDAYGSDVVLSVAPGVVNFDAPGVVGGRMMIDSSGNLLVGTTSTAPNVSVGHVFSAAGSTTTKFDITSPNEVKIYNNNNATGTAYVIDYRQSNISKGGITVGSSSVTYATTSDYRLKTDAQPMVGASDRVLALKPVNFEWISSGERVDGFLAHEAQEIVPECVTGTKDAVDADGNPDYQGIDQSKLVPLLTAALQEALNKIDAMEIRLSALEG